MRVLALRPLLIAWPNPFPRIEVGEEVPEALEWPDLDLRVRLGDVQVLEDEEPAQAELAGVGSPRREDRPPPAPTSSPGPAAGRGRKKGRR